MPQFLVAGHLPDNYEPSLQDAAMIEPIHALNREMIAAGVRVFACGISPVRNAKTLRAQPDGGVLITDGPYLEAKEHIGGFWILECADMDQGMTDLHRTIEAVWKIESTPLIARVARVTSDRRNVTVEVKRASDFSPLNVATISPQLPGARQHWDEKVRPAGCSHRPHASRPG